MLVNVTRPFQAWQWSVLVAQAELGRKLEAQRWGPRPIDLDIIFYHGQAFSSSALEIPHPRWHERSFVLAPLADLLSHDELHGLASNSTSSDAAPVHTQQQHPDVNSRGADQSTVPFANLPELQQQLHRATQQVVPPGQHPSPQPISSSTSEEPTLGEQPEQRLSHHVPAQAASEDLMQAVLSESQPGSGAPEQRTDAAGAASAAASDTQMAGSIPDGRLSGAAPQSVSMDLQQALSARVKVAKPGVETTADAGGSAAATPAANIAGPMTTEMVGPDGLAGPRDGLAGLNEGLRRQLSEASRRWKMWQARAMAGPASGESGLSFLRLCAKKWHVAISKELP